MTKPTRFLLVVAGCTVAILAGCGDSTAKKNRLVIQKVLDQDAKVTDNATSVAQIVLRMRAIEYSECPADFREAYVQHIHAWELLEQVEVQAKQYDAEYNSGGALFESFIRGAMGDPFGKTHEAITATKQLRQNYQQAAFEIKSTLNRVEEIAVRYGATLPMPLNQ